MSLWAWLTPRCSQAVYNKVLFTSPHCLLVTHGPVWSSDNLRVFLQSLNLWGYFYKSQPPLLISCQNSCIPMNTSHFHSKRLHRWLTRPCSLVYIRCENNWHLYSFTCSEAKKAKHQRFHFTGVGAPFYSLQMWRRTRWYPSEIAGKINTE